MKNIESVNLFRDLLSGRKSILFKLLFSIVLCSQLVASGCLSPGPISDYQLKSPSNLQLPMDARAEIVLPFGNGDRMFPGGSEYGYWFINEGNILRNVSRQAFQKIFTHVGLQGDIASPHFIIKIDAIPSALGVFKCQLHADITYGSGRSFGSYHIEETMFSLIASEKEFRDSVEGVYTKAFIALIDRISKEPYSIDKLKKSVSDEDIIVASVSDSSQEDNRYKNIEFFIATSNYSGEIANKFIEYYDAENILIRREFYFTNSFISKNNIDKVVHHYHRDGNIRKKEICYNDTFAGQNRGIVKGTTFYTAKGMRERREYEFTAESVKANAVIKEVEFFKTEPFIPSDEKNQESYSYVLKAGQAPVREKAIKDIADSRNIERKEIFYRGESKDEIAKKVVVIFDAYGNEKERVTF